MKARVGYLCLLLVILTACGGARYSTGNYSDLYDDREAQLRPSFRIFHDQSEGTQLYVRCNTKDLLYTRGGPGEAFTARVQLHYRILDNFDDKNLIDSATHYITDSDNDQVAKDLISKIGVKTGSFERCVIRITTTDLNRKQETTDVIYIDKQPHQRQYFLAESVSDSGVAVPLFKSWLAPGQKVLIRNQSTPHRKLFGRFYRREFPLAYPPFSMYNAKSFDYAADSLFTIPVSEDGVFELEMPGQGFIHLQSDTSTKSGLTLYSFGKEFPALGSYEEMLPPLRYLTSNEEYLRISTAQDGRQAAEEFWVECAGSKERAREVISQFYKRVQNANTHFTSYLEGWKTDRGLIHIIYGQPNTIYKTRDSEIWIYGEEQNINSTTFTFTQINNPFTDNDFALIRSVNFKTGWYRAIESWRNGRVYSSR